MKRCLLLTFVLMAFTGWNQSFAQSSTLNIDNDGAWCWFGDPRAVSNDTATYISYLTSRGYVVVSKLSHATRTQTKYTFPTPIQIDDHNNPALHLLPDGNLMIFFSEHNGNAMFYTKTRNPGNLNSFLPLKKIPTPNLLNKGFTYPNPVSIKDNGVNKLFLFWRGDDWSPTFAYTTNSGDTWTMPKTLVKNGVQRPYVKYYGDNQNRIHITMTDGHPSTIPQNSVYYMYYENGSFYKANHQLIGTTANMPFQLSQLDKVYVPGVTSKVSGRAWVWSVAVDQKNQPMISYSVSNNINSHDYYYSHWNGTVWEQKFIDRGGDSIQKDNNYKREDYYTGGIFFDQNNPSNLYLSKQAPNKNHVIQQWRADALSGSYRFIQNLSDMNQPSFRPVVPLWKGENSRAQTLKVLWMTGNYEYYTDYTTAIKGIFTLENF